jgi:hypothetical protein
LLPVTETIRDRIEQLDGAWRLPDYLGGLAGFPTWRTDDTSGDPVYFEPIRPRAPVSRRRAR